MKFYLGLNELKSNYHDTKWVCCTQERPIEGGGFIDINPYILDIDIHVDKVLKDLGVDVCTVFVAESITPPVCAFAALIWALNQGVDISLEALAWLKDYSGSDQKYDWVSNGSFGLEMVAKQLVDVIKAFNTSLITKSEVVDACIELLTLRAEKKKIEALEKDARKVLSELYWKNRELASAISEHNPDFESVLSDENHIQIAGKMYCLDFDCEDATPSFRPSATNFIIEG